MKIERFFKNKINEDFFDEVSDDNELIPNTDDIDIEKIYEFVMIVNIADYVSENFKSKIKSYTLSLINSYLYNLLNANSCFFKGFEIDTDRFINDLNAISDSSFEPLNLYIYFDVRKPEHKDIKKSVICFLRFFKSLLSITHFNKIEKSLYSVLITKNNGSDINFSNTDSYKEGKDYAFINSFDFQYNRAQRNEFINPNLINAYQYMTGLDQSSFYEYMYKSFKFKSMDSDNFFSIIHKDFHTSERLYEYDMNFDEFMKFFTAIKNYVLKYGNKELVYLYYYSPNLSSISVINQNKPQYKFSNFINQHKDDTDFKATLHVVKIADSSPEIFIYLTFNHTLFTNTEYVYCWPVILYILFSYSKTLSERDEEIEYRYLPLKTIGWTYKQYADVIRIVENQYNKKLIEQFLKKVEKHFNN